MNQVANFLLGIFFLKKLSFDSLCISGLGNGSLKEQTITIEKETMNKKRQNRFWQFKSSKSGRGLSIAFIVALIKIEKEKKQGESIHRRQKKIAREPDVSNNDANSIKITVCNWLSADWNIFVFVSIVALCDMYAQMWLFCFGFYSVFFVGCCCCSFVRDMFHFIFIELNVCSTP